MGCVASVHDLWPRGLLRLLIRQTRDKTFPQDTASSDAFDHARRAMDVVLCAQSLWRACASPCHN